MTSDDSLASGVGSERANSRSISFKNESTDASVEVPKLKLLIAFLYTHYIMMNIFTLLNPESQGNTRSG